MFCEGVGRGEHAWHCITGKNWRDYNWDFANGILAVLPCNGEIVLYKCQTSLSRNCLGSQPKQFKNINIYFILFSFSFFFSRFLFFALLSQIVTSPISPSLFNHSLVFICCNLAEKAHAA